MDVVSSILAVFSEISGWLLPALNEVQTLFWTVSGEGAGQLTFVGVVSVISLGIGITCMLIGILTNFIKLRS